MLAHPCPAARIAPATIAGRRPSAAARRGGSRRSPDVIAAHRHARPDVHELRRPPHPTQEADVW
jgi:hypothetical protein